MLWGVQETFTADVNLHFPSLMRQSFVSNHNAVAEEGLLHCFYKQAFFKEAKGRSRGEKRVNGGVTASLKGKNV